MKKILILLLLFISLITIPVLNASSYINDIVMTDSLALDYNAVELKDGEGIFYYDDDNSNLIFFIYTSLLNPSSVEVQELKDITTQIELVSSGQISFWEGLLNHEIYFKYVKSFLESDLPSDFFDPQILVLEYQKLYKFNKVVIYNGYWGYIPIKDAIVYSDIDCTIKLIPVDGIGYFEDTEFDNVKKFIITIQDSKYLDESIIYYIKVDELPIFSVNAEEKKPYQFEYFSIYKGQWTRANISLNQKTIKCVYHSTTKYIPVSLGAPVVNINPLLRKKNQTHPVFYCNFYDSETGENIPIDQVLLIRIKYTMYDYDFELGSFKFGYKEETRETEIVFEEPKKLNIIQKIFSYTQPLRSHYRSISKGPFTIETDKGSEEFDWMFISDDSVPYVKGLHLMQFKNENQTLELVYSYLNVIYYYDSNHIVDVPSWINPDDPNPDGCGNEIPPFVYVIAAIIIIYLLVKIIPVIALLINHLKGKNRKNNRK